MVNPRGYYGTGRQPPRLLIGRELTDAEIRDALAAGNRRAQPLADDRLLLMRQWQPEAALSREQLTTIIDEAVKLARETEKNVSSMIDKVPEHWESILRNERNIINSTLDQVPKFQDLIAKVSSPTVVPGFRDYIDRLLRKVEDGVTAMGYVAHVLPNWLRGVELVSKIHSAVVGAIRAIVSAASTLGGAAVEAVKAIPTALKVAGVGVLAIGGIWAFSKLRTSSTKRART